MGYEQTQPIKLQCGTDCGYIILWLWYCGCPQALACCKLPVIKQTRADTPRVKHTHVVADLPSLYSFQSSTEPWTWLRLQRNTRSTAGQTNINQRAIHRKSMSVMITQCVIIYKYKYVTLRSLLLVRKSVEGFRIAVMAFASSSCTVRVVLDVCGSVLNTNWFGHIQRDLWESLSTNTK